LSADPLAISVYSGACPEGLVTDILAGMGEALGTAMDDWGGKEFSFYIGLRRAEAIILLQSLFASEG
jgi:hypothetical protein